MSAAAPGKAGASAAGTAGAGAAGQGFDALMAALISPGAPGGPDVAASASVIPAPTTPEGEDAGSAEAPLAGDATDTASADAAATALAATLAAQQPATQPAAQITTATATDASAHAAPAWGREKAKGTPAQPALVHANPKADLAGKASPTPGAGEYAQPLTPDAPEAAPAAVLQQQAQRPAPAGDRPALPSPVAANMPAQVADAMADTPAAPPAAPAETTTPDAATDQASILTASQATSRNEAPAAPAPRTPRSERSRVAEADASSALKPTEAVDRPIHAKAVDAAAKPASSSGEAKSPEVVEADFEAPAETTDATLPAADAKAAGHAAGPAAHITHAVRGSPETVANLAAQIVKKLEGQSTRFDLELNPNGLGKVDVRIEIGAQGQLSASMLFDNAQAAQELKSRATELQRALEQAGFDLSGGLKFDVADQGRHQGQAWQEQAEAGHAFRGQAFRSALETAGDADVAAQGALRLRRGVNAGLDLRI